MTFTVPQLGLQLTATHTAEEPLALQISEHRELIALSKELGFGMLIAGQHFAAPEIRYMQPVPYLASLAEAAEGMLMATGILLLPMLHPLILAEEFATLDAVTGGRIHLGVAIGYSQHEFDAFGVDRKTRTKKFETQIDLLRRFWAGESVTHHDEFYDFDEVSCSIVPEREGGIPIWIGAQATPSVNRAARIADGWYVPPFPTNRELIDLWNGFTAVRAETGRALPEVFPVRREIFVADTLEEAEAQVRIADKRYETYAKWGLDMDTSHRDDRWLDSRFVAGTPEMVAEKLAYLLERVPATHVMIKPQWVGQPHVEAMKRIERIATDVMPLLAKAADGTGV